MSNDKFRTVGVNIAEKATVIWKVADMLRARLSHSEIEITCLGRNLTRLHTRLRKQI